MATFDQIRVSNPSAVPNGTDLIVVQKADGTPAAYTLSELSSYTQSVGFPAWQTDAYHGAHIQILNTGEPITHTSGQIVTFGFVVFDSGFYTNVGVLTIPTGVTMVEITAAIACFGTAPKLEIIRNGQTSDNARIASSVGANGFVQITSGPLSVSANQTFSIIAKDTTQLIARQESFLKIRTIEKLS